MAQRVDRGVFGDAALEDRATERTLETAARDGPALVGQAMPQAAARRGREQPLARAMGAPIVAQPREDGRGQGHVAIPFTFAVNVQQHPPAVDIGDLEPRAFEQPQSAGVDGGQALAVTGIRTSARTRRTSSRLSTAGNRVDGAGRTNRSVGQDCFSVCSYRNRIPHRAIVAVVRATFFSLVKYKKYWRSCSSVRDAGLTRKCAASWRTAAT